MYLYLLQLNGHTIAQAVSRRILRAAARVRAQVRSFGICGGQSGTGTGFLRVLRFPLLILIPPTAPHSSSSFIRGWYNRPINGRRTNWAVSLHLPWFVYNFLLEPKHENYRANISFFGLAHVKWMNRTRECMHSRKSDLIFCVFKEGIRWMARREISYHSLYVTVYDSHKTHGEVQTQMDLLLGHILCGFYLSHSTIRVCQGNKATFRFSKFSVSWELLAFCSCGQADTFPTKPGSVLRAM
jgi:hypothetical protein